MKKASKILFLIGGILTILGAIAFLGLAIVCIIAAGMSQSPDCPQWIQKLIVDICNDYHMTGEEAVAAILTVGIVFVVFFVLSIPAAILSFICSGKDKRPLPLLIVATAFSLMAGSAVSTVGGILGIVSWSTVERKEREQKAE